MRDARGGWEARPGIKIAGLDWTTGHCYEAVVTDATISVELWDDRSECPLRGVVLGEMMGDSGYWSTDCFWWPLVNLTERDKDYASWKAEKEVGILFPGDT